MLTFTIIILICILVLGVSLLASHWNSGAKSGESVKIETLYKKNWRSFFWISLRVLSFASAECCFLLMIFVIGSWFISIPILIIYICSAVQAIRHRDYKNKVFLGFHCFNVLQLLCFVIFWSLPISS